MVREELCIRACKYAIGELTRKGSSAFITSAHEGRQQISWDEVVEWLLEQEPCEDMEKEYEKAKALFRKVVKSEDCIS